MLIQNTNPVSVAPDQEMVKRGFAREDLFVCVHEQFMTETAQMADVVLPATMFMEHDDVYQGGGHQYILLGPKLIEPPGECRSNHEVICGLAKRVGAEHPGFAMTPRELIDWTLQKSGWGTLERLERETLDRLPAGFRDRALHQRLRLAGREIPLQAGLAERAVPQRRRTPGPIAQMPKLPDHWTIIEEADAAHPFRLATSPSRGFLNSTFNETPTSRAREGGRPTVMIHPDDAAQLGIADGAEVVLGNTRGQVRLHARLFDGVRRGVLIAESIWPNDAYPDGRGINTLTGADAIAPYGGAAFHDNKVWIRPAAPDERVTTANSTPTVPLCDGEIAAEAAVIDRIEPHRVGDLGRQTSRRRRRPAGFRARPARAAAGRRRSVADLNRAEVLRQVVDQRARRPRHP